MIKRNLDTQFVNNAVDHVNKDHAEAILCIVKVTFDIEWPSKAILKTYNHENMEVVASNHIKEKVFHIPLIRLLKTAQDFRPVLIEMLTIARKRS
jgi:putative heme iron utilization protein